MRSNWVDVLGLPLPLAQERLQKNGFEVETISYTFSPKQQTLKSPRVVRQRLIGEKKVSLVVANSPWVSVTS